MTDEIRKLLGGYATNTLTETERQALFEAALDDQELFDALQREQPLRDLLDDPVSRVQIRQALDQPKPAPWWSRWWTHWWTHWWTWTAAGSAVAASLLTMAIIRTQAPPVQQRAAATPASQPAAAAPLEKLERDKEARRPEPAPIVPQQAHSSAKQVIRARPALAENERKDSNAPTAAPAAPPPPAVVAAPTQQQIQLDAAQSRNSETQAQNQGVVGGAINDARQQQGLQSNASQLRSFSKNALSVAVAPVPYTLLKRDAAGADQALPAGTRLSPGDAVRISVSPTISGYLFLSREDPPGQFTRVYPETGMGLPVGANGSYVIPASAIDVTSSQQRFRVTLIPASTMEFAAGKFKAKTGALKKEANPNPPLFVDVVIGPR